MTFLKFIPVILSTLMLSAHFLRIGRMGLVILPFGILALLFTKKEWARLILPLFLFIGALIWVNVTIELIIIRQAMHAPWLRLLLIMGGVSLFTVASATVFFTQKTKAFFQKNKNTGAQSAITFCLTTMLLTVIQLKVPNPMLLAERFWHDGGFLQILCLATFSAWVTENMLDPSKTAKWRQRLWLLFSIVFFGQLILGALGFDRFLMTGTYHLPVPAIIIAGPIYRAEGFFMPILFLSTLLLVGPAWCSHLCYFGAFDQLSAKFKKRPRKIPKWANLVRIPLFVLVIVTAITLRLLGASQTVAVIAGLGFGMLGVGVMVFLSTRWGAMAHCVIFCPVGLLANIIGKLSPFRVAIKPDCDGCARCSQACRYNALTPTQLKQKKVGLTCTLCGDCISSCKKNLLEYRIGPLKGPRAQQIFITMVIAIYTTFLAVARI